MSCFAQGAQQNPDYATMFRGRPLRFVMPLEPAEGVVGIDEDLLRGGEALPWTTTARAHRLPDGQIFLTPEKLCDLGCETPRIHYERFLGRPYRYFYAISSDVDLENPGTVRIII
jgi:carotenoid isomerooxygenase